jgi:hypothetical protein
MAEELKKDILCEKIVESENEGKAVEVNGEIIRLEIKRVKEKV